MRSVLFVCTANICRSPTAAAVLRRMLAERGVAGVRVDSAGTHPYQVGNPPFELAVSTAASRGYAFEGGAARCISPRDFESFDHIIAMDRGQIANLRSICPTHHKHKLELLLDYGDRNHGKDVPDPYRRPAREFEKALDLIEEGCRGLADALARIRA